MKGKIAKINPKTWGSEGKTLYEFFIDGSTMKYVCFSNMADKKEGDEIEFDPQGPPDTYGINKGSFGWIRSEGWIFRSGWKESGGNQTASP